MRPVVIAGLLAVAAACATTATPPIARSTALPTSTVSSSTTASLPISTDAASTTAMDSTSAVMTSIEPTTTAIATTSAPASTSPPTTHLPAQPVVESRIIGTSLGGRAVIAMHKPGSATTTRRVLVVGQIHGEESAGIAVVRTLVSMHIPERVDLWMITTINPDGGAIGRRGNNHGVDLNRNFPTDWLPPGGPETSAEHYSGTAPASEPETQAAMAFIAAIHPDVTIWYHQPYHWVDCELSVAASVCRPYAAAVGDTITHELLPGTATGWQTQNGHGLAFVVEFGYGTASAASLMRHANAAVSV